MGKYFFSAIIFALVILPKTVFAIDAPALSSPNDGSTVTTSQLSWQTSSSPLYATNPYRVQVDNDSNFSSPEKDYSTANTTYTPSLDQGQWHWRVRAKDSNGNWSEWSNPWSFNLSNATPSPTSTPSFEPTSEPTTQPSSSPTASPTSPPAGTANSTNLFMVSSPPGTVHHDQIFTLTIQLTGLNPSATYYLKGAFVQDGSTNYFGQTKTNGNWVKNNGGYNSQFVLTTDSGGNWSGNIDFMADASDSGFTGTGEYLFKVGRYNSSGSGPTWSDHHLVTIDTTPSPSSSPTSTPTPSPKPSDYSTTKPSSTSKNTATGSYTASDSTDHEIALPNLDSSQSATVAGQQAIEVLGSNSPAVDYYWYIIAGIGLLLTGASPTIYLFLKPKLTHATHYLHRLRNSIRR